MFFDPYNRRGRSPWGPVPAPPQRPVARTPWAQDPYARDPYAHYDERQTQPIQVEPPPPPVAVEPPPPPVVDKAQLSGALRELEAAKARVERDAKQVADDTRKKLVAELLPVLDNLDRTIQAAGKSGDAPALVEGIRLVRAQLEGVLRGYGVERIDATGALFDPAIHDAITQIAVADPAAHRRVVDQIEPGYRYGDKLLRPAKVVVGAFRAAA